MASVEYGRTVEERRASEANGRHLPERGARGAVRPTIRIGPAAVGAMMLPSADDDEPLARIIVRPR